MKRDIVVRGLLLTGGGGGGGGRGGTAPPPGVPTGRPIWLRAFRVTPAAEVEERVLRSAGIFIVVVVGAGGGEDTKIEKID